MSIDKKKDLLAVENGFEILRMTLDNDIIDVIKIIDKVDEQGFVRMQRAITIKAKDLAAEITNFNTRKNDLKGETSITVEHVKNNKDVRNLLAKSGIKPESLPAEEDIKKLERRVKADDKKMIAGIKKIKK